MVRVKGVHTHFPPTVEQPLDYKFPMPPVSIVSVLNQRRRLTRQPFNLSETDGPNHQIETTVSFEHKICSF